MYDRLTLVDGMAHKEAFEKIRDEHRHLSGFERNIQRYLYADNPNPRRPKNKAIEIAKQLELSRENEGGSKPIPEINHGYKPNQRVAPPQTEAAPVFSCQKTVMDYVTLEGIENRTGIEKQNLYGFVLKELLDNAIDSLEAQYRGQENNNTITTGTADLPNLKLPFRKKLIICVF